MSVHSDGRKYFFILISTEDPSNRVAAFFDDIQPVRDAIVTKSCFDSLKKYDTRMECEQLYFNLQKFYLDLTGSTQQRKRVNTSIYDPSAPAPKPSKRTKRGPYKTKEKIPKVVETPLAPPPTVTAPAGSHKTAARISKSIATPPVQLLVETETNHELDTLKAQVDTMSKVLAATVAANTAWATAATAATQKTVGVSTSTQGVADMAVEFIEQSHRVHMASITASRAENEARHKQPPPPPSVPFTLPPVAASVDSTVLAEERVANEILRNNISDHGQCQLTVADLVDLTASVANDVLAVLPLMSRAKVVVEMSKLAKRRAVTLG